MISEKASDDSVKRFESLERAWNRVNLAEHEIVDLKTQIEKDKEIIIGLQAEKELDRETINGLQAEIDSLKGELKKSNGNNV